MHTSSLTDFRNLLFHKSFSQFIFWRKRKLSTFVTLIDKNILLQLRANILTKIFNNSSFKLREALAPLVKNPL